MIQPDGQGQGHRANEGGLWAGWLAHMDEVSTNHLGEMAIWRDQGRFVMGSGGSLAVGCGAVERL